MRGIKKHMVLAMFGLSIFETFEFTVFHVYFSGNRGQLWSIAPINSEKIGTPKEAG